MLLIYSVTLKKMFFWKYAFKIVTKITFLRFCDNILHRSPVSLNSTGNNVCTVSYFPCLPFPSLFQVNKKEQREIINS